MNRPQHLIQRLNGAAGGGCVAEDKPDYGLGGKGAAAATPEPKFVLGPAADNCGISSFFPPVSEYNGGGVRYVPISYNVRRDSALQHPLLHVLLLIAHSCKRF